MEDRQREQGPVIAPDNLEQEYDLFADPQLRSPRKTAFKGTLPDGKKLPADLELEEDRREEKKNTKSISPKESAVNPKVLIPAVPMMKKGSKDDSQLYDRAMERMREDFNKSLAPEIPVEKEKPSVTNSFFSYIGQKIQPVVVMLFKFSESKVGRIMLGTATARIVTIVFATLIISGMWPPAIPFVLTASVISLSAVAVGVVVDILKTRSLRKLAEESDLLVKNRGEISKQDYLLGLDPKLAGILKSEFARPNEKVDKYKVSNAAELGLSASKVLTDTTPSVANFVANTMIAFSGNPLAVLNAVRSGAVTAASLAGAGLGQKFALDVATILKVHINEEHQYAGKYSNIKELQDNVEKQHIKTLALTALIRDKNYLKLSDEEKLEKFQSLTKSIEQSQGKDKKSKDAGIVGNVGSVLQDLGRAHDPFYDPPAGTKEEDEFTKVKKKVEKAEKAAKRIVTPEVKELMGQQQEFNKFGNIPETAEQRKQRMDSLGLDPVNSGHSKKAKNKKALDAGTQHSRK